MISNILWVSQHTSKFIGHFCFVSFCIYVYSYIAFYRLWIWLEKYVEFNGNKIDLFEFIVNKEGMSRLPKRMQQAKRVAPPAVPEIYRHSGSSFGSAGYVSCDEPATNMGGGSNFYATANDPNNSLNVSLRSNTSNNSSIDQPDSAPSRMLQSNAATNASGMSILICWWVYSLAQIQHGILIIL